MINLPDTKMCHLEFQDEWLTIVLDNHKKRNALSSELIDELMEVLDLVRDEKVVRGILIKGQNNFFCSVWLSALAKRASTCFHIS